MKTMLLGAAATTVVALILTGCSALSLEQTTAKSFVQAVIDGGDPTPFASPALEGSTSSAHLALAGCSIGTVKAHPRFEGIVRVELACAGTAKYLNATMTGGKVRLFGWTDHPGD